MAQTSPPAPCKVNCWVPFVGGGGKSENPQTSVVLCVCARVFFPLFFFFLFLVGISPGALVSFLFSKVDQLIRV